MNDGNVDIYQPKCKDKLTARVVELVDTPDLGSGAERCGGSSPPSRTKKYQKLMDIGDKNI